MLGKKARNVSIHRNQLSPLQVADTEHGEPVVALSSPSRSENFLALQVFVLQLSLKGSTTPVATSSNRADLTSP